MTNGVATLRAYTCGCGKALLLTAFIATSMGASCTPSMRSLSLGPAAPTVLSPTSSAGDIVTAINANTARVTTYQATQASFTAPGLPGLPLLNGAIAIERPRRFRLRATTRLTGPELDAGGNDQRFWFWARRNDPPGLYTADYASLGNRSLTIDPSLVIDAIGLPTISPTASAEGPFPRGDGRLEVRTTESSPTGIRRRVIVVDAATAWPVEQQIYDSQNTLVASVSASQFVFDPASGASLPRKVNLQLPAAGMSLAINTGPVVLNAPVGGGDQLWQLPTIAGVPTVDLARTNFSVAATATGSNRQPIAASFAPATEAAPPQWQTAPTPGAPVNQPASFAGLPNGGVALPPAR